MKQHGLILTGLAMLLAFAGCSKHDDYLYYLPEKAPDIHLAVQVKEMTAGGAVDILWVIDNSGSMEAHQGNVIQNTQLFMQGFINKGVSWKMGLVSTDIADQPYLGFASPFDFTNPDPITTFQNAVTSLGTDGSGTEMMFSPILQALTNNPTFLRPGAPLAVLIVTDAIEQSPIDAPTFIQQFKTLTGGRDFYVYSVLAAQDIAPPTGCETDDPSVTNVYAGSPFEAFAKAGKLGHPFSICSPTFGTDLQAVGNEIVSQVFHPEIRLTTRPKPSTLVVSYQGKPLPPGPQSKGGIWFYDSDRNSIVFYSLDFAKKETDGVTVDFSTDDGLPTSLPVPIPNA